ncbi:type I-E CRISPR-associated protein Cse1/CasA [Pseudoclavibacter albus]|uniref:type I-E CRISPR-associated protein Cse1/CasA n=1 Tax=Pseudoclavibacter albus TaxID=272241 RepID=UPI000826183F|nr:type I-E CRISPR-associated protein Cse1/CasA [Pseudoclavibacter alba]
MTSTEEISFNLIDEPWVLVELLDGSTSELGLAEVFSQAHEIRRLQGELASQDFAMLRVLLAILYRALDPVPQGDPIGGWDEFYHLEELPIDPIVTYLETWRERFDLCGPTPFLQTAELRNSKDEWKSLSLIVPDSDPDGALFTMRSELNTLSLAEAARWLVHCQAYDPSGIKMGAVGDPRVKGGKGYPIGIGWCGWLGGTWIEGDTLRETLLLNLVLDRQPRSRRDIPIWEETSLPVTERDVEERGPHGLLGLLTWPQRRLRLRVEDGVATAVLVANGDPIDYLTQNVNEVMTPWRFSEPQTTKAKAVRYMPRALSGERAMWRGLSTLLPHGNIEQRKTKYGTVAASAPAGVLVWAGHLIEAGALEADKLLNIRVVSFVYGTQSASYERIVSDELRFVAGLTALEGEQLRSLAVQAAQRAEEAARAVRTLANAIAQAAGGEAVGAGARAEAELFAEFDRSYPEWLGTLRIDSDLNSSLARWTQHVRGAAQASAERLVAAAPPGAWVGRVVDSRFHPEGQVLTVGTASSRFRWQLGKALGDVISNADSSAPTTPEHEEHGDD